LKIKKCRHCLVETGPHNVRRRAKLQYHICRNCEDGEDKIRRTRKKMHVLEHYGEKCVCCGITAPEFLSMHHINGDGSVDRKSGDGDHIWDWIIKNNYPDTFQILCFNRHLSKSFSGYCPHELQRQQRKPSRGNRRRINNGNRPHKGLFL
jgi:hypothetical protein